MGGPTRKPDTRQNDDIGREGDVAAVVEPEDEDRRVRPGERRPERIMP